jgi:hypothetical protein
MADDFDLKKLDVPTMKLFTEELRLDAETRKIRDALFCRPQTGQLDAATYAEARRDMRRLKQGSYDWEIY